MEPCLLSPIFRWYYEFLRILIERIRADILLVRPHDGAVLRTSLLEAGDIPEFLRHPEGKQVREQSKIPTSPFVKVISTL
jgi:hypothetical protein